MNSARVHNLSDSIHARLTESHSFEAYRKAFRLATGLPMRLVEADPNKWDMSKRRYNQSHFCEVINLCTSSCEACLKVNRDLVHQSSIEGPTSCKCFSGMTATSIPIFAGTLVVGYLKTGQVFQASPTEEAFQKSIKEVGGEKLTDQQIELLRKAYFETTVVSPKRYQSMITLLEHFSRELSAQAERLAIAQNQEEPESITRARQYIHARLNETISLPTVARIAGMSESHFCRQFKLATAMTLTEYVNYSRILWAKKELTEPKARISEIAFLVGFQSLSQFNRCFTKFQGCSPTQYRDEMESLPSQKAAS